MLGTSCKNSEIEYPIELKLYNKLNIYNKFHSYNLHKDLLIHNFNDFNNSLIHYLNNGFCEGRRIYKFPCLIKKRILFVCHEFSLTGATKVGLDIANNLQHIFDVVVISWNGGDMINNYTFENKPIIIGYREFEHDLIKYLDRLEFAKIIINELNPDLVYINSSVSHDFYHASLNLNIPNIYHAHEGVMGFQSELKGYQIPMEHFCKYYKPYKSIFYSASSLTTHGLREFIGVDDSHTIKEFQTINFTTIDNLQNEIGKKLKIDNKKIIGMVGTQTFRKGYDLFLELAQKNKEYYFCWVGCDIQNEIEYNDNLILIKFTQNPYIYIKQFDYFLCTSREDVFGLILLESLYLKIPTFLLKNCISSWNQFAEFGAMCLDGEPHIQTFESIIHTFNNYTNKINIDIKQLKTTYDITYQINSIINDIITLTNGIMGEKNKNYYYHEKYGYITYNFAKIDKLIKLYHTKREFNYEIYKNKYKDLELVLKTKDEYEKHWNEIGHKMRNCEENDWKLFISENKNVLFDCIDSKEQINEDSYFKIKTEFNAFKYLNKYDDLKKALNDNLIDAHNHYLNHGCWEGRSHY